MTTPEGSATPALLLRLPLLAGDTILTDRYAPDPRSGLGASGHTDFVHETASKVGEIIAP